ncbi:MAG: Acetate CoA-transferase subunit alpha [Candidatus Celerinatantimonas neptuna]|nr:MAG: Acetate CoA-transferase subunit alpha [Candidatus Celerinatantimonas neptuna]
MLNKYARSDEIISLFHDGQTLMCGGFANHGVPNRLIDCIIASGAKHFTFITNDSGDEDLTIGRLIHRGLIDKLIASHIGRNPETVALVAEHKIELELVPQGSLAERMRCGGSGLGGVLTKTGLGTVVEEGKPTVEVDGQTYLLERPLRADIGLVRARACDPLGNLTYRGTMRNFNPLVAQACDVTLVDADMRVDIDELGVDRIMTPGVYVDKVLMNEEMTHERS